MNVQVIYHRPESNFCFATDRKTIVLRLRFAKGERLDALQVAFNNKYDIISVQKRQDMAFLCSDEFFDYYKAVISAPDGRLAYVFEITFDGITKYFCENGLSDSYDYKLAHLNSFQYAYVNSSDLHENVEWLNNAVFYQIFPDRFFTFKKKDYANMEWNALPTQTSFAGGDLDGITAKLDYISSLGVNAIYLTPIFQSKTNHKYDISNYYKIDKMFGENNSALRRLVDSAHQRGIRIVLDAVFNHCSEDFPPFVDVKKKGKRSKFFDWFIIDGDKIDDKEPNYCCFASCKYMPKLNTSNENVKKYFADVGVFWIKKYKIDGWRLDVSDEVSHDFWRYFRKQIKSVNQNAALIGENWHNSESFLQGDQFDSIMNYAFTKEMIEYFAEEKIDEETLANRLNGQLMRYTDATNSMMYSLLDSHDTHRFFSLVHTDKQKFLAALAVMTFMCGSCSIYYGTEILTEGGYDPDNRRTFDWNRVNDEKYREFTESLKSLIRLKREKVFCGDIRICGKSGEFTISRFNDTDKIDLIVTNNGKISFEIVRSKV